MIATLAGAAGIAAARPGPGADPRARHAGHRRARPRWPAPSACRSSWSPAACPTPRSCGPSSAGVDIVVATPGRLIDLMEQGAVDLGRVEIMVLDEADHMADLGFMPAVTQILDAVPAGGQRLLFSATLDRAIDRLVKQYLNDPVTHEVDSGQASVTTMAHHVVHVAPKDKTRLTAEIASRDGPDGDLRPHPARRRPGRRAAARAAGVTGRSPARRTRPGGPHADPGGLQGGHAARPGRHRRRRPRHPRRRHRPGPPGRPARRPQGVPAPRRPHGPGRWHRRRRHPRAAAPASRGQPVDRPGRRTRRPSCPRSPGDAELAAATGARPASRATISEADYQRLIAPPPCSPAAAARSSDPAARPDPDGARPRRRPPLAARVRGRSQRPLSPTLRMAAGERLGF